PSPGCPDAACRSIGGVSASSRWRTCRRPRPRQCDGGSAAGGGGEAPQRPLLGVFGDRPAAVLSAVAGQVLGAVGGGARRDAAPVPPVAAGREEPSPLFPAPLGGPPAAVRPDRALHPVRGEPLRPGRAHG